MNSERRAFLKDTCKLCASIVGISIVLPAIEGCAPLNYYSAGVSNGKINVPLASFVEETNMVIVKDKSLNYQVAVIKQKYDLNGKVTNTPASTNLKEFPIEVINETIQIQYL